MEESASSTAPSKPRDEARRFVSFALIGAAVFVVDAVLLQVGVGLGLAKPAARVVSLFLAMNLSFALNRAVTFASFRGTPLPRQWAMFMAANSLGAGINYLVFLALGTGQGWFAGAPVLAVAAGSIAGLGFNFTASRLTAFRK
jgi:putative flippase GtrA